jgi:hypothetical protein
MSNALAYCRKKSFKRQSETNTLLDKVKMRKNYVKRTSLLPKKVL